MNYDKKIKAEDKIENQKKLIKKLSEDVFEYNEVLKELIKKIENSSSLFNNSLNTLDCKARLALQSKEGFKTNNEIRVETREPKRLKILASELNQITNDADEQAKHLEKLAEDLNYSQNKVLEKVEDLDDFYKVAKANRTEKSKLKKIKKAIYKFETQYSKELGKLKGSKYKAKEFDNFHSLSQVEKFLKHEPNDKLALDSEGYYMVDQEYFLQLLLKFKDDIRKVLRKNFKELNKVIKNHSSKERLERYLFY